MDYERAYEKVKGKSGPIPAAALSQTGAVGLRQPSADTKSIEAASAEAECARETSDVMYQLNNYRTVTCECGTRLRVPPAYPDNAVRCPRCGRINRI